MSDRQSASDEELYSYTSSKTFYKRGRSRPSSEELKGADYRSHKVYVSSDTDEQGGSEYLPVSRWAVDYNNKNYVRSLCNKNVGLHRKLKGRPQKFKIQYDNNYFTRSKVNAPKGLHRKIPEIKRKYVPDDDVLADATGWEFDYGPEFDQIEQDVNFIPEGRVIRRGCYRWYGVKRNDSDYDLKLDEDERENLLNEELEEELKYGQEFLQSDIPYMEEQKNRRYSRGGYRFYETLRNVNDFKPEDLSEATRDPEWKRKYHCNGVRYIDQELCDCERDDAPEHRNHIRKGKPFRRTILNKVYELRKVDSSNDVKRHATRLSLVPGSSRQSLYEGVSDRVRYGIKKSPSVKSVFKKKTEKFRSTREGGEYEEYEKEDTEQSYTELRPMHEERRVNRMTEIKHGRRLSDEDLPRKERGSRRFDERTYLVKQEDNDRLKRRHRRKESVEDVRENYETWKENTLYKKEEDESGHHIIKKKSKERRKEKFCNERDYPLKNIPIEKRRDKDKHFDRREYRSQRPTSSSRDRHHGNEIRRQAEGSKVKSKRKGHHYIDANLQHIRDRGKCIRAGDKFEAELIQDKDEVLKKMPPHVEQRVKNIRKRMEEASQKHKDRRNNKAFDHSSSSEESIDLMKHKGHPNDRGETHNSEFEKYITKNGSEIWVKKNEKYAELHHKSHR